MNTITDIHGVKITIPEGAEIKKTVDIFENYFSISDQNLKINGEESTPFNGIYFCELNDHIEFTARVVNKKNETITSFHFPITLKVPLVRHADGSPTTDEVYFNARITDGMISVTGKFPWSGDWKLLANRANKALERVGAEYGLALQDLSFLV